MTIGLCFWILMLLTLVFGIGWGWEWPNRVAFGRSLLLWFLLFLLGWSVFGFPIKG